MHQLRSLLLFFFFISVCTAKSEQSKYNSWKDLDTLRYRVEIDSIRYLNKQAKELSKTNFELALKYSSQSLKLAVKIQYMKGLADSYYNMGIIYKGLGEYSKSLNYQLKSLNLKLMLGDKVAIARAYNNVAVVYALQNDLIKALDYHLKALKLKEEVRDEAGLAVSYMNIGFIYSSQKNHKQALDYYFKALRQDNLLSDSSGMAIDLKNIGIEYYIMKNFVKSKEYLERALKIKLLQGKKDKDLADLYNNLANIEADREEYAKAIRNYERSLEIYNSIGDKNATVATELNLGAIFLDIGKFQDAKKYLDESLKKTEEIGSIFLKINVYELLMKYNEKINNYKEAYSYSKLFKEQSDLSSKQNNFEKLNELGIKYETEKKEKEIKLLNKDKDLITIEIAHQKTVRNYFLGLAIIILISTFFIFRLYRNKQKDNVLLKQQKLEIESQKKSITDSINYAYRIQKSILPSEEMFKEILPESFVFNRPKDIVSGDFYWLHETSPFKYSSVNSKVLIAMADCTGHGVPGAFMSMIGVELLNEAVNESHSPAKILQLVDEGIRKALHTNHTESKKDGMDMALCAFDFEKNSMKFCGANRPIYRIRKGVLDIFQPHKTAVGFSEQGYIFNNTDIEIQKDDCFYLFSDGYADQFGGERDKKLTTKKFKELLISVQNLSMPEQGSRLEAFILNWSAGKPQVDDMLVIGLKV